MKLESDIRISRKSHANDVTQTKKLQSVLLASGYDIGKDGIDGVFGPASESALKKLQDKLGITPDGIAYKETSRVINKYIEDNPQIAARAEASFVMSSKAPVNITKKPEPATFETPKAEPAKTETAKAEPQPANNPAAKEVKVVKLDHAPGESNKVALVIPKNYNPNRETAIVVYNHGYGGGMADALNRQHVLEQTSASGKNVVLVIPQLGAKSDVKEQYNNPAYASKFITEARGALADFYKEQHPDAKIGATFEKAPLVAASYSGGYKATMPLLSDPNKVQGLVMMDSLYCSPQKVAQFASRSDSPAMFMVYGPTTEGNTNALKETLHKHPHNNVHISEMSGTHTHLVENQFGKILNSLSINREKVTLAQNEAPQIPAKDGSKSLVAENTASYSVSPADLFAFNAAHKVR